MKIGFVQFAPVLGSPEVNRREVERLVSSHPEADLLVLPELCSSGYRFRSREEARAASEPVQGGPFVELLVELSRRHRTLLVGGFCERSGDRLYNSAVLVGPGGLIGHYRKLHLFMDEKDIFTPGDIELSVHECVLPPGARGTDPEAAVQTVRLGMLICFDWQFPEVWRVLALKGADIVCHPSNLVLPGKAQRAVPVLAMLNRVYALTANRIGTERDLSFTGRSILASPSGETLAEAGADTEEVQVIEVDPSVARDKTVTPRNDAHGDRRSEFYRDLAR